MLFSRLASLLFRVAQFVFAVVVLGLTAYFLHERLEHGVGPYARVIYTVVWSSLSVLFSIIWMIPTSSSMTGYVSDFVFTAGWAAAFGLLVEYFNDTNCGSAWDWSGISVRRSNACGQWRAAQAFSFLSMVMWFASFVLGVITVHRLSRHVAAEPRHGRRFGSRV